MNQSIQGAVQNWRLVYCNATNATIIVSPYMQLFENLTQVKEYLTCLTGITQCCLNDFISLLGRLPMYRVGTEMMFKELCSRLATVSVRSNSEELNDILASCMV